MMQGLIGMLKMIGFDPDALQKIGADMFGRFESLETHVRTDVADEIAFLHAEIVRLKDHLGLSEEETKQGNTVPETETNV